MASEQTLTEGREEDVSSSEQFKVRLMPFEQRLLDSIASIDRDIQANLEGSESSDVSDSLLSEVLRRWGPAVAVKKALRKLTNDFEKALAMYTNSDPQSQFILPEFRETACSAFFAILETPGDLNKCRSLSAKELNPHFICNLLQRPDVLQYLKSVTVVVDQDQKRSWRIIIGMLKKYRTEMYRWIVETHHEFQYVYYEDLGFEIVQIVRMYYIRHLRPNAAHAILDLCKTHNDDLASRFWHRYQEEQAQIAERRSEFYGAFGLTKESVRSDSFHPFSNSMPSKPDRTSDGVQGKEEDTEVRNLLSCF